MTVSWPGGRGLLESRLAALRASSGYVHSPFKDHKVGIRTFWYSDHAEIGAAHPIGTGAIDLVNFVLRWVNGTRKAIAMSITHDLDTPGWHLVPKRSRRFEINGIPGELDVCLASISCVRPSNIR